MDESTGIYCICNLINGKKYIGKSINLSNRLNQHVGMLRNNRHHSNYLQASYNKHGELSFIYGVVEYCDKSRLDELERYYVDLYNTYYNGYNEQIPTGENSGHIFTEEDKQKHSIAMLLARSRDSESTREKMRIGSAIGRARAAETMNNRITLLYDPNSLKLIKTIGSTNECLEFLGVNPKMFYRRIREVYVCDRLSYKGYVLIRPHIGMTIEGYSKNKYFHNEQVEINRIKKYLGGLVTKANAPFVRREHFESNRESRNASWANNLRNSLEARRSSGKSSIDVYLKDTNEYVGRWPLAIDFANEYNLKVQYIYKMLFGEKKSYKGFVFKRVSDLAIDI